MATTTWDTILPLVTPDIPGCPEATIKTAFAAVAADSCARTHIWRESLETQSTVVDQAEYEVNGSAVIESVLWILIDDREITHTDSRLVDHNDLLRTGRPSKYWVVREKAIRLFYIPDDVYTLKGEIALKPSRTARGVEDWIYETWADTLVSGVLWRLTRVPNKEWTNPDIALMNKKLYEQGVTNARIRDMRNVQLQVKLRRF